MVKQDWMVIVAGEALVDEMTAKRKATIPHNGFGYDSEKLCELQRNEAARGIRGVEIVRSNYGHSVRYDSGLQNFGLLAGSKSGQLDGTLEDAIRYAKAWVAADPNRRYAWYRK